MLLLVLKRLLSLYDPSACGGGVVSAELDPSSCKSDEPDAAGEAELSLSFVGGASAFIATSTLAASRSCTC